MAWARLLLLVALTLAGCVHDQLQQCGTELCDTDLVCTPHGCVTQTDYAACAQLEDRDPCTLNSIAGTCVTGVCEPIECGNGRVEPGEVCDDRNQADGDGCSADCISDQTCGNGIVDVAVGEQCDDGVATLSGDGCNSRCLRELDLWSDATPLLPHNTKHALLAFDGRTAMLLVDSGTFLEQWELTGENFVLRTPAVPLPVRLDAGTAYDPVRHQTVVFGGHDGEGHYDSTFTWDGTAWTEQHPLHHPSARSEMALAWDPASSSVLAFGGTPDNSTSLGDLWRWDGTDWSLLHETTAAECTGGLAPCARRSAGFGYVPMLGGLLLVGDAAPVSFPPDSWLRTPTGWTKPAAGVIPTAYGGRRAEVVPAADDFTVLVLGADLYFVVGNKFEQHGLIDPTIGDATPDGQGHALLLDGEGFLSRYTPTGFALLDNSASPGTLSTATFDSLRQRTVVLRSTTAIATWEYDGTGWTKLGAAPVPRRIGALAYDPDAHRTLLFGGTSTMDVFDTLSAWDGTAWTDVPSTGPRPDARRDNAIAYDEARHELVVFGGFAPSGFLADTWTFRDGTWTAHPGPGPAARQNASMTFDAAHGQVVLFGGRATTPFNDTWLWDGTTWMLAADAGPPARTSAILAYEPLLRDVLLAGGTDASDNGRDLWAWDGDAWTKRDLITRPPAANLVGARAPFGGLLALADTIYRFQSTLPTVPTETCRVEDADLDGDGAAGCDDLDCWYRCTPDCPPNASCTPHALCGNAHCDPSEDPLFCPEDCVP